MFSYSSVAGRVALAILFACSFFGVPKAYGQTSTGEITGSITDTSGAVLVEATVTVTNPATGAQRVIKTNSAGVYDVPSLSPGTYTVRIEMQGFNAEVHNDVELQVAQVARIDASLQVGSVANTVEVSTGAPVLETESASLGTVVENRRIEQLPLNGRNYLSLTGLTPGVTNSAPVNQVASSREGGVRGSFTVSASGQREYFNHYTLDGAENTEPNFNAYFLLPSLDALQEFKVETGIFPAEYGHNVTNITASTKSGANAFHGTAFEFLRNADISSKNYFANPALPAPQFQRNQFGGTVGGPIKKDKLFFFFNYEGTRERKGIIHVDTVPSANWRQGIFTGAATLYDPDSRVFSYVNGSPAGVVSATPFSNNVIPSSELNQISVAFVNAYIPLPNVGGINNSGINNYVISLTQPTNNDQENVRVDYLQSANSDWMFRFAHATEYNLAYGSYAGMASITQSRAFQGLFGNTWSSGGTKVNDAKLSLNYLGNIQPNSDSCKQNPIAQLGIPNYPIATCFDWGIPNAIFGAGEPGAGTWADWEGFGQATDNFSWVVGRHTFKFGGEYGRFRFNGLNGTYNAGIFTATGQYTTNGLSSIGLANTDADAMLGLFEQTTGLFGEQVFNLRYNYFSLYAEDSWKVSSSLTVNYGVRWEDQTAPIDVDNGFSNVAFAWNNSITPTLVRAGCGKPLAGNPQYVPDPSIIAYTNCQFGDTMFKNDPFNFGPRLGIAWSLGAKTVIRAGAGIFFAHEIANGFIEGNRNPPFSTIQENFSNPVQPTLSWQNLFPPPFSPSFLSATERNEPTARSEQWSFGVQRQLAANSSLEVTYMGTAGVFLPRFTTYNTAPPGPGSTQLRQPFPQMGLLQVLMPSAHSSYEALQARFEQRFSHGFTVLSAFSYGKSIDDSSSLRKITQEGDTRNPLTPWDIRSLSAFDFRRRWVTSILYEIPVGKGRTFLANTPRVVDTILGGWQLSGIYTMQDGMPLTPSCNNFSTYQNGGNQLDGTFCYPNATGINPNLPQGQQSPSHWFNTAAFVNQTPFSYGNAGRDTIIGPGIIEVDASITKNFNITEHQILEFRAECFNVANHPLFSIPNATVGSPSEGVITSTIIDSREFQFALRYTF